MSTGILHCLNYPARLNMGPKPQQTAGVDSGLSSGSDSFVCASDASEIFRKIILSKWNTLVVYQGGRLHALPPCICVQKMGMLRVSSWPNLITWDINFAAYMNPAKLKRQAKKKEKILITQYPTAEKN